MAVSLVDRLLGRPTPTLIVVTFIAAGVLVFFGYKNGSTFMYTMSGVAIISAVINIVRLKNKNADKGE